MQMIVLIGGDERDRTVDPCLAKAALSQLSYIPITHEYVAAISPLDYTIIV